MTEDIMQLIIPSKIRDNDYIHTINEVAIRTAYMRAVSSYQYKFILVTANDGRRTYEKIRVYSNADEILMQSMNLYLNVGAKF